MGRAAFQSIRFCFEVLSSVPLPIDQLPKIETIWIALPLLAVPHTINKETNAKMIMLAG
jgi:hypothetical protein